MEGRKKVLLIDDEDDVCFFLKGNLELTGEFDVLTTTSGKEGIEFARGEKPDLILLDLNMPEMSGDEVAQILSDGSDTKTIPIVFITALITKGEVGDDSITNIGGYNYVAKPVATEELVAVIRRILN
ncbi:MAG: response regulator [Desulfobacterales bacterium]